MGTFCGKRLTLATCNNLYNSQAIIEDIRSDRKIITKMSCFGYKCLFEHGKEAKIAKASEKRTKIFRPIRLRKAFKK